ncbi:MAG: SNF2 helicase-associated domain-containing protein [Anaerolineae bacterium]|nr:SNF2 helicase-associated domain-containing protein [Anaerolineae bacterium]
MAACRSRKSVCSAVWLRLRACFAPLEQTLRAACPSSVALTTPEAYTFLREAAPLLEQSGFGILTPPWWQKRAAALGVRLKLKQKQTASEASGLLSFAKVVEYDWQLAWAKTR